MRKYILSADCFNKDFAAWEKNKVEMENEILKHLFFLEDKGLNVGVGETEVFCFDYYLLSVRENMRYLAKRNSGGHYFVIELCKVDDFELFLKGYKNRLVKENMSNVGSKMEIEKLVFSFGTNRVFCLEAEDRYISVKYSHKGIHENFTVPYPTFLYLKSAVDKKTGKKIEEETEFFEIETLVSYLYKNRKWVNRYLKK